MKRIWLELVIGVALLAIAGGLFFYSRSVAARARGNDRQTLVAKLRSDVAQAVSHASLTEDEKARLVEARRRLREASAARDAGKPYDKECARQSEETLRQIMDNRVLKGQDRSEIDRTLAALRELERREEARRRRANFVQQLGFPLGILADFAVEAM